MIAAETLHDHHNAALQAEAAVDGRSDQARRAGLEGGTGGGQVRWRRCFGRTSCLSEELPSWPPLRLSHGPAIQSVYGPVVCRCRDSPSRMGTTMTRCLRLLSSATLALASLAFVAPVGAQSVASDPLSRAKSNCLASVAKTVGLAANRLKVIQQTSNSKGFSIDVKVPNATAPWACLTDRQGKVDDVHFKGSEGAL